LAVSVWAGQLCQHCTAGHCDDPPSPDEPARLLCPRCQNNIDPAEQPTCEACEGRGYILITQCPHQVLGNCGAWDVIRAAGFAEKGLMPSGGGWLDQTQFFIDALEQVWAEQAQWKRHLSNPEA
jgi:hypothetical protein